MRVLLDECVPAGLRLSLSGHDVRTAADMGWSGYKNGRLLEVAAAEFGCFLTVDRNLQFQQSQDSLPLAVLIVAATNNRLASLLQMVPEILTALNGIKPGQLRVIGSTISRS